MLCCNGGVSEVAGGEQDEALELPQHLERVGRVVCVLFMYAVVGDVVDIFVLICNILLSMIVTQKV